MLEWDSQMPGLMWDRPYLPTYRLSQDLPKGLMWILADRFRWEIVAQEVSELTSMEIVLPMFRHLDAPVQ